MAEEIAGLRSLLEESSTKNELRAASLSEIRSRATKNSFIAGEVELPPVADWQREFLSSDVQLAKVHAAAILEKLAKNHYIQMHHKIPVAMFITVKELLEPYGMTVLKCYPISEKEAIFEFRVDPNKFHVFL